MYYLSSLAVLVLVSVLLEVAFKEHLFRSFKQRALWVFLALVIGIAWDMYAIPNGHWVFPGGGILGIYFYKGIPVEELLWFLVVPYFFLTVYATAHGMITKRK